ncbi:hypothetical protein GQ42DRAFT_164004 [Ramicandelaber brevisporus]|nr:hypothetical protein GQ42DRAFT_164004 [Ramicandelaber brevisporus]
MQRLTSRFSRRQWSVAPALAFPRTRRLWTTRASRDRSQQRHDRDDHSASTLDKLSHSARELSRLRHGPIKQHQKDVDELRDALAAVQSAIVQPQRESGRTVPAAAFALYLDQLATSAQMFPQLRPFIAAATSTAFHEMVRQQADGDVQCYKSAITALTFSNSSEESIREAIDLAVKQATRMQWSSLAAQVAGGLAIGTMVSKWVMVIHHPVADPVDPETIQALIGSSPLAIGAGIGVGAVAFVGLRLAWPASRSTQTRHLLQQHWERTRAMHLEHERQVSLEQQAQQAATQNAHSKAEKRVIPKDAQDLISQLKHNPHRKH